jgi:hypothetical protein
LISALGVSASLIVELRWLRTPKAFPNAVFTTVFQTATRKNPFIALTPATESFTSSDAVNLIAMLMAV